MTSEEEGQTREGSEGASCIYKDFFLFQKCVKERLQDVQMCLVLTFGMWVSAKLFCLPFVCVFENFFEQCLGNSHG